MGWDERIEALVGSATDVFGLVAVLAVLVAGFAVGRHWMKKLGDETPWTASNDPTDHGFYGSTHHDNGYVTVHHESGDKNFRKEDYDRWEKRWK